MSLSCCLFLAALPAQTGNLPPVVSAGSDATLGLFESALLDGSVSDDGLPTAPGMLSTVWRMRSGPGVVSFANRNAVDTTARFSAPGTYELGFAADDGQLTSKDRVTVSVLPASVVRVPADQPTIQAGIDSAQERDLILVSPGLYSENLVLSGKTVTLASKLLTSGDAGFIDQTIIDGGGGVALRVDASVGAETTITGFTIRNSDDGISAYGRLRVLDNRFVGNKDALDYEGGGGLCRGNVFEGNSDDGIDLDGSCAAVIEGNVIRNNDDDGIEVRLHAYSGPVLEIVIRNNVISGNLEDGIQLIDYPDLSDRWFLIQGNVLEGNALVGLGLMDGGNTVEDFRAASIPEPIDLIGNTFVGNDHALTGGDNLVAIDNLFVDSTTLGLKGVDAGSIAAHNLFWNNGVHHQGSHVDLTTTLFADPLLGNGLRLQPGSPALDAGTAFFQWRGATVLDLPPSAYTGGSPDLGALEDNQPPQVFAGADRILAQPTSITLVGTVFDDGLPNLPGAVTARWSQTSGPGRVHLADPAVVGTRATFTEPGTYVLRLIADDGQAVASDEVRIDVL